MKNEKTFLIAIVVLGIWLSSLSPLGLSDVFALEPEAVEAANTDEGGGRPPTGTWVYSLENNDGTESFDDVLDPGEKVTRLWRIEDEGGRCSPSGWTSTPGTATTSTRHFSCTATPTCPRATSTATGSSTARMPSFGSRTTISSISWEI